jgi:NDP-hexose-3-ketoreductase
MSHQIVNIAVMGCAAIAERSMIPAIKSVPNFRLIAVASRSEEKAERFAEKFDCEPIVGYEKLLIRSDIDAIYMPLPTGLHHEWINKCLNAGKHVLAEKSIAYDYHSALEMVSIAKANSLVLMEDFMFQYHSQHQFVLDLIKKREIGEIRVFRANFGFPPMPKTNFRYDDSIGGGALLDAAGYTVRAVHFILGDEFVVKAANLFFDKETGTNIYGGAFLDNGNGVSAQIAFGMDHYYQCNFEIWGSEGKIIADRAFTAKPDYSPLIIVEKQDQRKTYQMPYDNHFIGSINEFHKVISSKDFDKHFDQILLQSKTLNDIRRLSSCS